MRPLLLHGHERSVLQVKYNKDGDLLFSCAKDSEPNVWFTANGERLGSFPHLRGTVWQLDPSYDSRQLITASADGSAKIWDVSTGREVASVEGSTAHNAIRSVGFSFSAQMFFIATDRTLGQRSDLRVYDLRDPAQVKDNNPGWNYRLDSTPTRFSTAIWSGPDRYIVAGLDSGDLMLFEVGQGGYVQKTKAHTAEIKDIQASSDGEMVITSSKDFSAKLFDSRTLENKKVYKTERPVNGASISPNKPHVVLVGGQEAMDVTTTVHSQGKFFARFFHLVFEEEFARVKGHFGTINTVQFRPDGRGFASGGEDGYIRLHEFDSEYHEFELEY